MGRTRSAIPGSELSDAGATARFYKAVSDAHLCQHLQVNLSGDVFTSTIDEKALNRARMMDGKLILVSMRIRPRPKIVSRQQRVTSSAAFFCAEF